MSYVAERRLFGLALANGWQGVEPSVLGTYTADKAVKSATQFLAHSENVGEEFVERERCHVDTPESNTIVVGMLGDVRVCRECAEDEA